MDLLFRVSSFLSAAFIHVSPGLLPFLLPIGFQLSLHHAPSFFDCQAALPLRGPNKKAGGSKSAHRELVAWFKTVGLKTLFHPNPVAGMRT